MKRAIGQVLKRSFRSALKRRCPEFVEIHDAVVPAGAPVFCWDARPRLSFYLVLVTWSREDKFTIEGAWSESGEFPSDEGLSAPRDCPYHRIVKDQPVGGKFRFRLPTLWLDRGEFWWEIVPPVTPEEMIERFDRFVKTSTSEEPTIDELRERIEASAADAVDRIVEHFIPYCRSMLE